ncbi:hypothetical protein O4J56_11665 [Nocardiopsis sp. RSe5-2]|uniref:Tetratricopeptide repeat protein n=1 Tax=Nocardiopsis endophytica TaxID=3018445 RepID=A0ABT4U2Z1_9ACTN|nr:hypothetical protein [Nocardiopsis endophytica]MDA2811290.1 hypothetical protein [Nocardiopsis endophytica]
MYVERASGLLAQCAHRFWEGHGTDGIGALLAEAGACYDAAETADAAADGATVAIGRSLIAEFELRLCIDVENDLNSGWDFDWDGPPLNGVEEDDEDGVSRPVAVRAAEAARAAMDADPQDPLVPVHLGHALAWLGDRDGAVAAYREALRRDPFDDQADACLEVLGAGNGPADAREADPRPSPPPRPYAFALLREEARIANSEWITAGRVFGTPAALREAAEAGLRDTGDITRDDLDDFVRLQVDVHRPGRPVAAFDLTGRVPTEPQEGPFRIDWSGVPLDEPLTPPIPPGRPVRVGSLLCF